VNEDADAVAFLSGSLGDVAEYASLAAAGTEHHEHLAVT
jgi:hypothetical protein